MYGCMPGQVGWGLEVCCNDGAELCCALHLAEVLLMWVWSAEQHLQWAVCTVVLWCAQGDAIGVTHYRLGFGGCAAASRRPARLGISALHAATGIVTCVHAVYTYSQCALESSHYKLRRLLPHACMEALVCGLPGVCLSCMHACIAGRWCCAAVDVQG
jgi:hypothetical protein